LLQRDQIMLLLLFIIFYKLGDALALSLMSNFLLHGLGFSLTEVGIAYKINSLIAGILGALIGGLLLTRKSLYFCLFWFGIMQAASTLLFALLASLGKQYFVMIIAIFAENFCSGMSAAAFLAFLMSLCNLRYTATQFAFMSAIASCGRIFLGPLAATMVTYLGWVNFYLWSFALSFPSLFLLYFMRNQVTQYANMATQN
ncbi:MAG: AmpG protein, partial [uncultured bacterium]